jgi:hypothetical protein
MIFRFASCRRGKRQLFVPAVADRPHEQHLGEQDEGEAHSREDQLPAEGERKEDVISPTSDSAEMTYIPRGYLSELKCCRRRDRNREEIRQPDNPCKKSNISLPSLPGPPGRVFLAPDLHHSIHTGSVRRWSRHNRTGLRALEFPDAQQARRAVFPCAHQRPRTPLQVDLERTAPIGEIDGAGWVCLVDLPTFPEKWHSSRGLTTASSSNAWK